MERNLKGHWDHDHVRKKLTPVRLQTRKLAIHLKRKLLQEVQVGKVVMSAIENIFPPYIKLIINNVMYTLRKRYNFRV